MAVLAIDLPYNLGLVTASIAGIVTGLVIKNAARSAVDGAATGDTAKEAP